MKKLQANLITDEKHCMLCEFGLFYGGKKYLTKMLKFFFLNYDGPMHTRHTIKNSCQRFRQPKKFSTKLEPKLTLQL